MNLRDTDNLQAKDKRPVPEVSFVQRFDCISFSTGGVVTIREWRLIERIIFCGYSKSRNANGSIVLLHWPSLRICTAMRQRFYTIVLH